MNPLSSNFGYDPAVSVKSLNLYKKYLLNKLLYYYTMLKQKLREEWMNKHPSIKNWIFRIAESTRPNYLRISHDYFTFVEETMEMTPGELLDLQDKQVGRDRFKQLTILQNYVREQRVRSSTKNNLYTTIRSFYAHNHVPLPTDPTFKIRSEKAPINKELTPEALKKIILSSNKCYRAIFLCMFQGAMGAQEFDYFNLFGWEQIASQLEKGKKCLTITFHGRKHARNIRNYYSFIGSDAIEAMQRYFKDVRGTPKNREAIFVNPRGNPVASESVRIYFLRHAHKTGIITRHTPNCPKCKGGTKKINKQVTAGTWKDGYRIFYKCKKCQTETPATQLSQPKDIRYKVSLHELRDLYRSMWELSSAKSIVAEFCMGHIIDPNEYNKIMTLKPEWAESQYKLAEPYLNLLSEDPTKVSINKIQEFEETIKRLQQEKNDLASQLQLTQTEQSKTIDEIKEMKEDLKKMKEFYNVSKLKDW